MKELVIKNYNNSFFYGELLNKQGSKLILESNKLNIKIQKKLCTKYENKLSL